VTHPHVIAALSAVMNDLPAIGKGDKSPQGYQYRGIEAITKQLQPLLSKHGVVIVPNASIVKVEHSPAMKEGWTDTFLDCEWTIYGPGGVDDKIVARTTGIGRDNSDKGANKAAKQAFKYLLLQMLSIADKADDADGVTYDHARAPEPVSMHVETKYSEEAIALFMVCKLLPDEQKAALKAFAAENDRKVSTAAFDTDIAWADQVRAFIALEATQTTKENLP
jgi:hypothetical protein